MISSHVRIVILASGTGSNAEAIIKWSMRTSNVRVQALITDRKNALVIEKAKKNNIENVFVLPKKRDEERKKYDERLLELIKKINPDLIVLAGFMKILGKEIIKAYPRRIVNIHPTLLPKYPGLSGYEQSFQSNDSVYGCTVHYVDEGVDTGEIIGQSKILRLDNEDFESFKKRGLENENAFYPVMIENVLLKIAKDSK